MISSLELENSILAIRDWVRQATTQELAMKLIEMATELAAERERCAKIAEAQLHHRCATEPNHGACEYSCDYILEIAAKIRSGEVSLESNYGMYAPSSANKASDG